MRHRIKGRKLNRTASHRKSLIRNLANQLFEHKEIKTTTAKAKEDRDRFHRFMCSPAARSADKIARHTMDQDQCAGR